MAEAKDNNKKNVGWISRVDDNGFIAPFLKAAMFKENRQKLFDRYSKVVAAGSKDAIVLQGGTTLNVYDTDAEMVFRQESNFFYLFGINEPDCFGVLDVNTKESLLFIPRLGLEYEVWCGKVKPCDFYTKKYGVDATFFADELTATLKKRGLKVLHVLSGKNSDSGNQTKEADFEGIKEFEVSRAHLYSEIGECRVIKSAMELDLLRHVNKLSSDAHIACMREAKEGVSEHELEAVFKYHTYRKGGCRHTNYTCICCSGENSAVLHYGHAGAPNDKNMQSGDMLLIDMGAEYQCYGSDITCSYPANGKFTAKQKAVYEAVLDAQQTVMRTMKPEVVWSDMHRTAERVLLQHLIKIGLLVEQAGVTREEMVSKYHLVALFMPHGLGHLMGMDVHDIGGYPAHEAKRIDEPGIRKLRTNRKLKPGMVLTVEPGLYFIPALLLPALKNERQKPFLNANLIEEYLDFGGVRLEDDVIVTADGCENMTKCPRTVEEVEAVMRGEAFPLQKK